MEEKTKLIVSILVDLFGMSSYAVPVFGELIDFITAPIEFVWILSAYKSTPKAILGGLEEILPFTDVIPMCTVSHFLTYKKRID